MNKNLFKSRGSRRATPRPDTRNHAGGLAYSKTKQHALAQYAVTGTFSDTYYAGAGEQMKEVHNLASSCEPQFLAQLAVYSREVARMKDMPAYLLAVLTAQGETELVKAIFDRVCNNSKMLLNFMHLIRSGAVGRRSFGTAVKRCIQRWLQNRSAYKLYIASVGHSNPSLADAIKMVHPRPVGKDQQTMFAYLIGKLADEDYQYLPEDVQQLELLKEMGDVSDEYEIPDVPFRALTNLNLGVAAWRDIARNMPWNTLRMNLNMLEKRGVFKSDAFIDEVAEKLADAEQVRQCNVFPYQLLTTYQNVAIDSRIGNALQEAMEIATENVPTFRGRTVVGVDVSGSMGQVVMGSRPGSRSVTKCADVASLFAVCVLRQNKNARIMPFDTRLREASLNPFDSVMSNAQTLRRFGGGTDCSIPLRHLNNTKAKAENVIYVSDNESWSGQYGGRGGMASEWTEFHRRNPKAKLVNIDITPNTTTQTPDSQGVVLNIGGFSDAVFTVMDNFFNRESGEDFVAIVENYRGRGEGFDFLAAP